MNSTYETKKEILVNEFKELIKNKSSIGLGKQTSNLVRHREIKSKKLNVKHFNNIINIDVKNKICEVEGMTTYEKLVDETLKYGFMPTVVPQLKTITIGGAVTGVGIESSSFKYGLVHETIEEMEILLGNGQVVIANKNKNSDLFYGFPNSYATLGYVLKLKVKIVPVKKYVKLNHLHYSNSKEYFKYLDKYCNAKNNFVDGSIFDSRNMYITLGNFVDEAPYTSNYKYMNIYYQSIITIKDYIWRWDTDWFWCSKNFGVQNKVVRFFVSWIGLKSKYYWKIMHFNRKYKLTDKFDKIFGKKHYSQTVVQDIEIPIENCVKFLEFFHKEIGIKPIWACPLKAYNKNDKFTLYLMNPNKLYVNFGFWDLVKTTEEYPEGYFDKKIEKKVKELNGKKSLYSTSYYSEEEFWKLYNKNEYFRLKKKYDSSNTFNNLYQKVVKRN